MQAIVTGGAGFIGRWVVKELLSSGHRVTVLDNLSGGRRENLQEFSRHPGFLGLIEGDIRDKNLLGQIFKAFDVCYHLAASINVQDSIDNPSVTFANDVEGTFNVLEECRKYGAKMVFVSTCMVYDKAFNDGGIDETHPVKPASPYAAAKLSGEALALSYYYAYGLPSVVLRPFNTYGPFQKANGEGGVVAVFTGRYLDGKDLQIFGDGAQTRDLLYAEDCARFIVQAGLAPDAIGEVINAGSGKDVSINDLAAMICRDRDKIAHIPHIHPQSEIKRLLCNYGKAKRLLQWEPRASLQEGLDLTRKWLEGKRCGR